MAAFCLIHGVVILWLLTYVECTGPFFPFQNTSLSWEERVDDLVKRLTLEEIILQLSKGGGGKQGTSNPAPAIPRLAIGPYQWNTECLRGAVESGNATSFPQALGLAATFNPNLIFDVAEATAVEVRAKHTDYVRRGIYRDHTGVSCLSPVVNIMRHPLWGRNQETYGEDPFLTGVLAQSFVTGLQGSDPRYLRTSAVCKHFDVHGGPENIPTSRFTFDAKVSERDWRITYLPQFKKCIDAGAHGILCSYNSVNGIPACANKKMLTDILRTEWGFNGYAISDEGALEFIINFHRYINNTVDTAAACVNAGLNLEIPGWSGLMVFESLGKALEEKKVTMKDLVERIKPLFYTRMRLGEFDPPDMNPYSKLNLSVIQSPQHRQLSLKAAMQTIVLLKNDGLLPLDVSAKTSRDTVAVVGPMADNMLQLYGAYSADPNPKYTVTPRAGLAPLASKIVYAAGCNDTTCANYSTTAVTAAVKNASVTVVCVGTGQAVETENHDRPSMKLPGQQEQLLLDVINVVPSDGKIIVVVYSAGPVDVSLADASPKVSAILQSFFPAQTAGEALYNILTNTGEDGNPAGRLPYTWYASDAQVPSMTDYSMTNQTYRYFEDTPLYPFGYGLSYSEYRYSNLSVQPQTVKAGDNVTVTFNVTNLGRDGDEVSQVYISWLNYSFPTPRYQLVGFNRQHLSHSQMIQSNFTITGEQMAVWVEGKGLTVEPGVIQVYAGGQLPDQNRTVGSNVLSGTFTVHP